MTHILIPRTPSLALLRPFIECPTPELDQAWAAMVRIAEVQHARDGRGCLAQIEEPAKPLAEICSASHDDAEFGERAIKPLCDISGFEYGTPLYAGAAPAAVTPHGDYPQLPKHVTAYYDDVDHMEVRCFSESQMHAYFDLGRQPAAAPTLEAPAAPAGWKLVPEKPTDAMLGAAQKAWLADPLRRSSTVYAAALAAAPQAHAAPGTPPLTPDEARWAARSADNMRGPSDTTSGTEYVMAGAMALAAKLAAAPQAPAAPAEGEVLVEVIGLTGSGKSAICGEIEILCRALGLDVSWPDGDPEKNMTHAEWTAAIEAYKPRVRIVERNVPRQSNGGPAK